MCFASLVFSLFPLFFCYSQKQMGAHSQHVMLTSGPTHPIGCYGFICRCPLNPFRPSNPAIPHLVPASSQANLRDPSGECPSNRLWIMPALKVSPAPRVSTTLASGVAGHDHTCEPEHVAVWWPWQLPTANFSICITGGSSFVSPGAGHHCPAQRVLSTCTSCPFVCVCVCVCVCAWCVVRVCVCVHGVL